MPSQITNYQCPACTGPLHFAGATGQLECEYCGSSYSVEEIEALYAEKEKKALEAAGQTEETSKETEGGAAGAEGGSGASTEESAWDMSGLSEDWGSDGEGMKTYSCPSCGAELLCDATTAATACPYCDNPTVVPGQFAGGLKPDFIIPFKLSKEDAVTALKKHYKNKPLLPGTFTKGNHLEEVKGIYVPFWMFDGGAKGSVSFQATRSETYRSGDYEVTETDHFDIRRSGSIAFERVPVDGSSKMPDDYMDSIEPYDYGELKPFSTAYLPGFLADKYDVSAEESRERADKRYTGSFEEALKNTVVGYDACIKTESNINLERGKVHYALLPVWILNTKWQGKDFLFAMNGQTGKLVGKLPVSTGRALGIYAAVAAPLIAISVSIVLWLAR